jgi:hypothetical protein
MALVCEQITMTSNRRLSAKFVPTFAMDPHGRIIEFLDRSCYYFFQVAPQLYSLTRLSGPRSRPTTSQKIW